jgi:uncharacterized delta-60 repeat protein
MKYSIIFALFFLVPCESLLSQVVDSTFGDAFYFGHPLPGATAIDFNERDDHSYATLFLDDGRIILAGHTAWDGRSDFAFARLLPDGKFDQTAGPDGKVHLDLGFENDSCLAATLYSSDRMLMGGCVTLPGQQGLSLLLIRTDLDGNLDPSFGDQGQVAIDLPGYREMITKVLTLPDGNIVIAGNVYYGASYQYPDSTKIFVGRLLPDGQVDGTFGSDGFLYQRFSGCNSTLLSDLLLYEDGSMLLTGGGYHPYPGDYAGEFICDPGITLCRFHSDGTPDTGFGENGAVQLPFTEGRGNALAFYDDGRILVVGLTSDFLTEPIYTIAARLMPDGMIDSTFSGDGYFREYLAGPFGLGSDPMTISISGEEILIGYLSDANSNYHPSFGVFCLNDSGELNPSFGDNGIFSYHNSYPWTNYTINQMALSPDKQKLYFGGWYTKLFHKNMIVSRLNISGKFPVNMTEEKPMSGSMVIYPNPVSGDKIYLAFSNIPWPEQAQLWVYDSFGRMTMNRRIGHQDLQSGLLLTDLPNGVYFIEILVNDKRYINKIVVQR